MCTTRCVASLFGPTTPRKRSISTARSSALLCADPLVKAKSVLDAKPQLRPEFFLVRLRSSVLLLKLRECGSQALQQGTLCVVADVVHATYLLFFTFYRKQREYPLPRPPRSLRIHCSTAPPEVQEAPLRNDCQIQVRFRCHTLCLLLAYWRITQHVVDRL